MKAVSAGWQEALERLAQSPGEFLCVRACETRVLFLLHQLPNAAATRDEWVHIVGNGKVAEPPSASPFSKDKATYIGKPKAVLTHGLRALAETRRFVIVFAMSVQDLETAVSALSREELSAFQRWFEEFAADAWDKRIEQDAKSGKLDHLLAEADREFEGGRCTPL